MMIAARRLSPAIRNPIDLEFPGDRALIRKEGEQLIIGPIRKARLLGLLSHWRRMDEAIPDVTDPVPDREDIF